MHKSHSPIAQKASVPRRIPVTKVVKDQIRGGDIHCVTPTTSVLAAATLLAECGIGALPVMDSGRLAGIISERDILRKAVIKSLDMANTPVSRLMTTDLITATPDDGFETCLRKMHQRKCRHLPILNGQDLVGFLSIKDLLQMLLNQRSTEIRNLQLFMWGESIPGGELTATWRCGTCGHSHEGQSAPEECPKCHASRLGFQLVNPA